MTAKHTGTAAKNAEEPLDTTCQTLGIGFDVYESVPDESPFLLKNVCTETIGAAVRNVGRIAQSHH